MKDIFSITVRLYTDLYLIRETRFYASINNRLITPHQIYDSRIDFDNL